MRVIRAAIVLIFAIACVVFCLQNLEAVVVKFLGWSIKLPMPFLVFVVYLLGMVSGWWLFSFLRRSIHGATESKS